MTSENQKVSTIYTEIISIWGKVHVFMRHPVYFQKGTSGYFYFANKHYELFLGSS